jgi:hypothetical protein
LEEIDGFILVVGQLEGYHEAIGLLVHHVALLDQLRQSIKDGLYYCRTRGFDTFFQARLNQSEYLAVVSIIGHAFLRLQPSDTGYLISPTSFWYENMKTYLRKPSHVIPDVSDIAACRPKFLSEVIHAHGNLDGCGSHARDAGN